MTETLNMLQLTGAVPGKWNYLQNTTFVDSGDEPPIDPYLTYTVAPVVIGGNSYEIWLLFQFVSPSGTVSAIKLYNNGAFPTGTSIKYNTSLQSAYLTPVKTASAVATATLPVSVPASQNVYFDGGLNSVTTTDISNYVVLQLQTTSSAAVGNVSFPMCLAYTVGGNTTTYTFTIYASVGADGSITPNIELDGIWVDYIDITGWVDEGDE